MSNRGRPFAVESPLPPHLDGLLAYWKDLCRGQADMPFADDIDMNRVRELVSDSFTLGVFAKPARYVAVLPHALLGIAALIAGLRSANDAAKTRQDAPPT